MRSGGNVSTLNNNTAKETPPTNLLSTGANDEKTAQTSKCKGSTTIPIFLKKTYRMLESSPPEIAAWTSDGEMFVVKDPDRFASQIIPQYFDHNKFSSFARQLNFYGFRKMQSKPIRNSDFDANTAKHVTFYNEHFKRGRHDLLKKIQRSTRGGGNTTGQDTQREIQQLKDTVANMENTIQDLHAQQEERVRRLELEMLGRMEQMTLAIQQQQNQLAIQQQQNQQAHFQHIRVPGNNNMGGVTPMSADNHHIAQNIPANMNGINGIGGPLKTATGETLDPLPYGVRGVSLNPLSVGLAHYMGNHASIGMKNGLSGTPSALSGGPTLPPHPKQKELTAQNLPGSMSLAPGRMDSLSTIAPCRMDSLSYNNLGGMAFSRGLSAESQGGNAFELSPMFGENGKLSQGGIGAPANLNPIPMLGLTNININSIRNGTNNIINSNNSMEISNNKGPIASGGSGTNTAL